MPSDKLNLPKPVGNPRRTKIITLILTVFITVFWMFLVSKIGIVVNIDLGDKQMLNQAIYLLTNPIGALYVLANTFLVNGYNYGLDYMNNMIGRMGFNYINAPVFTIVSSWFLIVTAGIYARSELVKSKGRYLGAAALGVVAAVGIMMTLYLTYTAVGADKIAGMHGRYFLPLLPFIISGLALLLPMDIIIEKAKFAKFVFIVLGINLLIACYYYYTLTYVWAG